MGAMLLAQDTAAIAQCIRHCSGARDWRGRWRAERTLAGQLGPTEIDLNTAAAAARVGAAIAAMFRVNRGVTPMTFDGARSCGGKIIVNGPHPPRTAGICFGCSRYGRRCEAPIAPAAHLVIPGYGASYWDCPNRRSSGANVTEVPADDLSPRIGGEVLAISSTSGVST